MAALDLSKYPRVRRVGDFAELLGTPFAHGVNALCWERPLVGDFGEVVRLLGCVLGDDEGVVPLDEPGLLRLPLSPAGRLAADAMLSDLRLLRAHDLDPALNYIRGYPRDETPGPVPTDVFSFHADSAPVPASTWLCTYHGPSSEGLRNEDAIRRVDHPPTRAALLADFGGRDDATFAAHLHEHHYDLHYAWSSAAGVFPFGLGHLWRIAIEHPGCPVPPCIHRAPTPPPGAPPRLLLIS